MNIFQKAITPDKPRVLEGEQIYVYVPQATSTNAGIAGYTSRDFNVNNSIVSLKWPIESKIQGPLNTASLVKVDSSEFENTNENIITEYEGNAIMSQTGIRLVRTERDAYNRPDFVMLDSDYFPRELIDKNGQKFYKYTTSAVHYIVQNLTEEQKVQARENINAGSLHAVEIANSKADNAVATALSAKDLALEALDTAGEADNTAKEALRYIQEEVGTQITVGEEFVRTLLFTSDPQEQINKKADTSYVNTELDKKADTSYVNTELAKRAGINYVNAELAKKASTEYVNTELAKKADAEYVNTELAKKADAEYVNTELAKKSDTTYVDQKIADLVGSAPDALNTLEELSAALNNNKDIVKTLNDAIALKADKSVLETDYLPLSAGSTKNLTGTLYANSNGIVLGTETIQMPNQKGILFGSLESNTGLSGNASGDICLFAKNNLYLRTDLKTDAESGIQMTRTEFKPFKSGLISLGTDANRFFEIHGEKLYGSEVYQNGNQVANKGEALPNYTLTINHGTAGNPRLVLFASVTYKNYTSNAAAYFKLSATSCHGNGTSYQYLEDIIIGVTAAGQVTCNVYKFCQQSCGTDSYTLVDGLERYYGDVFYVVDEINKIVYFYILCGQYASSQFTPFTKIGSTTTSGIIQYTGTATYYSSGTKTWANGCGTTYATILDISNKALALDGSNTMTGVLNLRASGANETNIGPNGIRWNMSSLPESKRPEFVCTMDAFASGGRQTWTSCSDLKTTLGVPTQYITAATVSNGAIVLTKQDGTTVSFAGSGITLNQWNVYESSNKLIFSLK